jgi:predicted component of type VI protein secretion system
MTKTDILETLKGVKTSIAAFFSATDPAAGEQTPAFEGKEYTTSTGEVLTIDKLEVGGIVKNAEGNPYASGVITLADGTSVTIGEGGAIASVEVVIEEVMSEPDPRDAEIAQLKAQVASLTQGNAQFSEQIEAAKQGTQTLAKQVETLTETMLQFAAEPSADPIKAPSDKPAAAPRKNIVQIARENKARRGE